MRPCRRLLLALLGFVGARNGRAVRLQLQAASSHPTESLAVQAKHNWQRGQINRKRWEPHWMREASEWNAFTRATGHNLEQTRSCPTMIDWMGFLEPMLVPRLKLAFCTIPKSGCTEFKDLFNSLNRLNVQTGFGNAHTASMPSKLHVDMSQVTRENGWKFVAFTRDPLARYFSAFGSTCVTVANSGQFEHADECCGEEVYNSSGVELRESFERRAVLDAKEGLPFEDQHWGTQVQHLHNCGWHLFNPEKLDFRGDITAGNASSQVRDMLRLVNASNDDLRIARRFFPEGHVAGHRNPVQGDPKSFYTKKEVVDAVKHTYAADFALLPGIGRHFTDEVSARAL